MIPSDGDGRHLAASLGERSYDINEDGVAHYGLVPDLLSDMERRPKGREVRLPALPLSRGLPAHVGPNRA